MFGRLSVFFSARDLRTGSQVLIKSFRQTAEDVTALRSFYREIEALRRLKHPNILEIIDYSPGDGAGAPAFVVLPWCRGGNLADYRRQSDFLPLEAAIPILRQIAGAIDHSHSHGVIHGDVKPQNVLLSEDRRHAFLSDFGMSKYFDVTDRLTISAPLDVGTPGGTSAYLSPEQLVDSRQSQRSDIYSFGLVTFELLTGKLPFDVRAPLYRQIEARVTGSLTGARDLNPALTEAADAALASALATQPGERPASAAEFCDMLTGARSNPRARPVVRSKRRTPLQLWTDLEPAGKAGIITAAIAALAAVIVALVEVIPALLGNR